MRNLHLNYYLAGQVPTDVTKGKDFLCLPRQKKKSYVAKSIASFKFFIFFIAHSLLSAKQENR